MKLLKKLFLSGGGSEHTIDGHRYAAEVHLVHFNKKYGTIGSAVPKADGLAVVGVFFEIAEEGNNDGSNNNKFAKFLSEVKNPGDSFLVTNETGIFTISELIRNEVKEYYSYKGSLTTPPCSQSVRWIVSKKPVKIYPSEIKKLSELIESNGKPLTKNFRPIQPLNNRKVSFYNFS
jgi:carbonic anhydrase